MGLYPLLPNRMSVDRDEHGELVYTYTPMSDSDPNLKSGQPEKMNIKEKVYQALMSSPELKALLVKDRKGRCIYPGVSPNAGSYPILVYNVISDVPALVA